MRLKRKDPDPDPGKKARISEFQEQARQERVRLESVLANATDAMQAILDSHEALMFMNEDTLDKVCIVHRRVSMHAAHLRRSL